VDLVAQNRSLTELRGVGPFIAEQIRRWIDRMPKILAKTPPIRREFLALADARKLLQRNPAWSQFLRGDLQMHTRWSDGSGTVAEMADAAGERGYDYIAITDHAKGMRIAGRIDGVQIRKTADETIETNMA